MHIESVISGRICITTLIPSESESHLRKASRVQPTLYQRLDKDLPLPQIAATSGAPVPLADEIATEQRAEFEAFRKPGSPSTEDGKKDEDPEELYRRDCRQPNDYRSDKEDLLIPHLGNQTTWDLPKLAFFNSQQHASDERDSSWPV